MGYIKAFFREDRRYFADGRDSIRTHNNHMLVDGCALYTLVLAFYTILSVATGQSALLRKLYYIYDGIHIALCAAVFLRPARWKKSFRATQLFCALLEASILSFFAIEGSVTTPDAHSLYVPIAILLVQLLFVHKTVYSLCVIFVYTASFALMSHMHKTPAAYTNDLYIAIATFISANIGYLLIARLRRGEQRALLKLENLSRTDALTGLLNKAALEKACEAAVPEGACCLAMIDLDDFKDINDLHGHETGDEVLRGMGLMMRRVFRGNDVMGRFGGDEFVVLMEDCGDPQVARDRLNALMRRVSDTRFGVPSLRVRFSAGVALYRKGDTFRAMFARADRALYEAKREGKNAVCLEDEASA